MTATPLGQILFWIREAHQNVLKLVEELSDEQLAWQPHPSANSIAFDVWHLARWADYVQARLPDAHPQLSQQLEARRQIWHAEDLAARWGLDPASLGEYEAGTEMGAASARMPWPGKAVLLEYLQRAYALEEQGLAALDDQLFQELIWRQGAPSDKTVGYWVMEHLVHEWEHYGMMKYVRGLWQLNASEPREAASSSTE